MESQANPTNVAYTSGALGFHTDLPYLSYPPNVQALHCVQQVRGAGGATQFVDGLNVADQLRRERPEVFRILSTVPLEYVDDGQDVIRFDLVEKRPVFA